MNVWSSRALETHVDEIAIRVPRIIEEPNSAIISSGR